MPPLAIVVGPTDVPVGENGCFADRRATTARGRMRRAAAGTSDWADARRSMRSKNVRATDHASVVAQIWRRRSDVLAGAADVCQEICR